MRHDAVVVDAGFTGRHMAMKLKESGLYDFVLVENAVGFTFDSTTDHWTVRTSTGEAIIARIVIAGAVSGMDVAGLDGVTFQQGMPTYLGVAVAGFPNFFLLPGGVGTKARVRYIMGCLRMMGRADAGRIAVKPHVQDLYNRWVQRRNPWPGFSWWRMRKPNGHHFWLTPLEGSLDETHRGPAFVGTDGSEIAVEVHLTGHLQPIDGSYQWFGRITRNPSVSALHQSGRNEVTVRLPGGAASRARLTEVDPWGNIRVTGTGQPPFPV